jgi:immune inhibitor A
MKILPKMTAMLVSTFLVLSMFAILPIRPAIGTEELPDYEAVDWQTGWAGTVEMPTIDASDFEFAGAQEISAFTSTPPVGTKAWDWYLRSISRTTATGNQPWMTLMAVSGNVEVWVQDYLWFLPGDPRNNDPYNIAITPNMIQYLADEFNNVIYPTDTTYFGMPFNRDGSGNIFIGLNYPSPPPASPPNWWEWIFTDNPQRVILKVLNIRDTNYNDPTYPYYTAGFFSPSYTQTYYKRNMIHIDCWRWWQRLGPAGTVWFPERPDLVVPPARANLYESVTVHEFQHNIHRDWNPNDESFMNEGCSDYSQMLAGYPQTVWGHVNSYLYTPDNSLTEWGDQGDINILADYGAGLLWAAYLVDHYGGPAFLTHFVQSGIPGIAGVDAALAYYGYTQRFDDVYHDWRVANLIHSDQPGDGRYNYQSIDLGGPDATPAFTHTISGLPIPPTKGTDFGTTKTNLGYDTGVSLVGPYGSDYIELTDWHDKGIVFFDGDDTAVYGWTMTADGWWSGAVNLLNTLIYAETYVDPINPTLELVTKYDTENLWDFGFVQVSTDGGLTWVSQSNAYTTMNHDPAAHPNIVANLPGLTGRSTGWPGWLTMTFDLTAYSGQTVLVGFRYMTDWATLGAGWYIQSAKVSGSALTLIPAYPPAKFQVTAVKEVTTQDGTFVKYLVNDMDLETPSNTGTMGFHICILEPEQHKWRVTLVVSVINHKGLTDYTFQAKSPPIKGDCNNDGIVDILDAAFISAHWYPGPPNGPLGYDENADINFNEAVDIADAATVSADWGKSWAW